MTIKEKIKNQGALLWRFLGFFQSPLLRCVHASIIVLVLLQFLTSTVMEVPLEGPSPLAWVHIIFGMLGIALVSICLKKRGLRYFFPYFWGDFEQLGKDLRVAAQFKTIAPRAKGLPACVQGIGMITLLLTVFSGLWWFNDWSNDALGLTALSAHTFFAWALGAYVVGHGGMALTHFALWQKKTAPKK